ncbi:hypothetical protein BDW59DRAFT_90106 [Aspergillus cavernicola]|uniref:Uncharacterized protein n=1 Tax=Aspergillus cavernicola TaxID=176166 RepID=A0ABR4I8G5_9EURO
MASLTMNTTRLRLRLRLPTPQTPLSPSKQPLTLRPPTDPKTTKAYYSTRPLPKLAQASLWNSLIPKFLRNPSSSASSSGTGTATKSKSKEWNPASFYIIIFLLVGSQAIRMIALKNEYTAYTRSTDAKIRLLREVIEKVKAGEQVDVERLLGSRGEGMEREWDDVLREIEREDSLWHQKQKKGAASSGSGEETPGQNDERKVASTLEAEAKSKDPVIPAPATDKQTQPGTDESAKDTQTKRKNNFF